MKCLVCNEIIPKEEYSEFIDEFKLYLAHQDCFGTFQDAEEFLIFAEDIISKAY